MSDSKPVIARFNRAEVGFNTRLHGQLATVRMIEDLRAAYKLRLKITGVAAGLAIPATGLWAAAMLYWRYYHAFDWSFVTDAIGSLPAAIVCGAIAAGCLAYLRSDSTPFNGSALTALLGLVVCGFISVLAFLWALPFVFPLLLWAAIIGLGIYYASWPHLGSSIRVDGNSVAIDQLMADNRYEDYRSFLGLQSTWNEYAELLNRLALKLEYNQFEPAIVPIVTEALAAMRADQRFVEDRCSYLERIAQEGDLGTKTARAQLGAAVIHELSGKLDDMRKRIDQLKEIDGRQVAALQVETMR